MRPARRFWCFLVAVGLPTLLVFLYLTFLASPRYVTEFHYSVYNGNAAGNNAGTDLTSTLQSNPSAHADYLVNDYLRSRAVLEDLRKRINLTPVFQPRGFDPLFHFWWNDNSIERLYRYWSLWVLDASYDGTDLLGYVSVRAFTPQDSLHLANTLIELSEQVVNDLGVRARDDAVHGAEATVARADQRMEAARDGLRKFRESHNTFNPDRPADSTEALAATLRQSLATLNAQLSTLEHTLSPTAPAVLSLKTQIGASERELDRVGATLGSIGLSEAGQHRSLPGELGVFEALQQERNFAAIAREAALRHLEEVRFDASVKHLYMQVHAKASLAQSPTEPKPLRWTLLTFATLIACWLIGTLLYYSVREHGG
jgi:capsular polysaccharide transport system permease protein